MQAITGNGTIQSAYDTLAFLLQDARGNILHVVAMGRHAEDPSMSTPGHEVALFFWQGTEVEDAEPSFYHLVFC